jgi:Pyruvate/2-oxoacid:ferredoxin oxidoreductase gamma subunit
VELEDVLKAVDDMMGGGLAAKNKAAVEAAYKAVKEAL